MEPRTRALVCSFLVASLGPACGTSTPAPPEGAAEGGVPVARADASAPPPPATSGTPTARDASAPPPPPADAGTLVDAATGVDAAAPITCPTTALTPGTHRSLALTHAGENRTYDLHVPTGADGTRPLALVLSFHGTPSTGWQQELSSGLSSHADQNGYLAAYPNGLDDQWNAGECCSDRPRDDVGFVRRVIDDIATRFCLDRRRVYATGMSNGGHLAYRLACEASDIIAAVAPVSARFKLPDPPSAVPAKNFSCTPARAVPLIHFHGTGDPDVAYDETPGTIAHYSTGAPDSVAYFARLHQCASGPTETWRGGAADACVSYTGCKGGSEVVLCSSNGGGHCWPGPFICFGIGNAMPGLDANALAWTFFQRFQL